MKRINVTQSSMPPYEEYIEEIKEIWDTKWLTNMGPIHNRFEEQLKEYLKTDTISLFTNGHMALSIALQVLGISGEVITTPFTFASTTHAIVQNGLKPVFCDINENDYTINTDIIESLINEKTTAIVPVHVYGNVCDFEKIEKIAKKHGLKIIYDAAHAFGTEVDGKGIGTFGDISMFSFHATKVFHTIEGGALTYQNHALKKALETYRNFGIKNSDSVISIGTNAKMNEFSAAMGICNLRHLDEEIMKRKAVVKRYRENLSCQKGIRLCEEQKGLRENYAYFPVVFENEQRDAVAERLAAENIFARKYFYPLTCDFQCYNVKCNVPIARWVSDRVLTLPLYADLTQEDVDRICKRILK